MSDNTHTHTLCSSTFIQTHSPAERIHLYHFTLENLEVFICPMFQRMCAHVCVSGAAKNAHSRAHSGLLQTDTLRGTHGDTQGLKCIPTRESTNHKSADFHPAWTSQIRFNIPPLQLGGRQAFKERESVRKDRKKQGGGEKRAVVAVHGVFFNVYDV